MRRGLRCHSEGSALLTRNCESLQKDVAGNLETASKAANTTNTSKPHGIKVFDECDLPTFCFENDSGTTSRLSKTPNNFPEEDGRIIAAIEHVNRIDTIPKPRICWEDKEEILKRNSWLALGYGDTENLKASNDDLQEAALRGDLELMRQLVHKGASVNAPMQSSSDDEFMTLLHVLARKPEMPDGSRILHEIIMMTANLNVRSSTGMTPLSCACLNKHVAVVELLLEAKADTSPVDDFGRTAANYAVLPPEHDDIKSHCVEIIELLANSNADLTEGGDIPPIIDAVQHHNCPAVVSLLREGARPDGLHEAVEHADKPMIQALLAAEANPFTQDHDGRTVMDIALARGDEEITTALRDFIGDLQRTGHPYVKSLDEQMHEEMHEDHQTEVVARNPKRAVTNSIFRFHCAF